MAHTFIESTFPRVLYKPVHLRVSFRPTIAPVHLEFYRAKKCTPGFAFYLDPRSIPSTPAKLIDRCVNAHDPRWMLNQVGTDPLSRGNTLAMLRSAYASGGNGRMLLRLETLKKSNDDRRKADAVKWLARINHDRFIRARRLMDAVMSTMATSEVIGVCHALIDAHMTMHENLHKQLQGDNGA